MLRRIFALVLAALLGCTTEPSFIGGAWTATEFTITEPGEDPADVLAAGGSLTINIITAPAGVTEGTLIIPGEFAEGVDVVSSMEGTFTLNGNTVTFDQEADTFVRDMTWTLFGDKMTATQAFAGVTIHVQLTRTSP